MNFGEFLDLICRMTTIEYEKSEMSDLQLKEKLNFTLNDIFINMIGETI